jgi:hypothetical protein
LIGITFGILAAIGMVAAIVYLMASKSNRPSDSITKDSGTSSGATPDQQSSKSNAERSGLPGLTNTDPKKPVSGLTVPSLVRPQLPESWVDFQHPKKEYSVYLPSKPILVESHPNGPPRNQPPNTVYTEESWAAKGSQQLPITFGMSKLAGTPNAIQFYYNSLTGPQQAGPTNKITVTRINWAGRDALELLIESETIGTQSGAPNAKKNKSHARYAIVDGKIYLFEVHNIGGLLTDIERTAFFESVVFGR